MPTARWNGNFISSLTISGRCGLEKEEIAEGIFSKQKKKKEGIFSYPEAAPENQQVRKPHLAA